MLYLSIRSVRILQTRIARIMIESEDESRSGIASLISSGEFVFGHGEKA
jgi:hypothetical protein